MAESQETQTLDTSSGSEMNSTGSAPPPDDSSSDGNKTSPWLPNLQVAGNNNSATAAPPPSSNSSNSSPPPDISSNKQSTSPPSDAEPPETSPSPPLPPPPPPKEGNSPPPNTQSPPSPESSPQSSPPPPSSSSSGSPPSPSKQQSPSPPPPGPPKQESPPPPSSSSGESKQSSPEKSPPNPSPSDPPKSSSESSPSPPPPSSSETSQSTPSANPSSSETSKSPPSANPSSSETSQSPPSANSTSPPSPVFSSPPVINGSSTTSSSSPGFSPQAFAPPVPSPPESSGSSNSGGSNNNSQNNVNDANEPNLEVIIGVTVAGVFIIALIAMFFFLRKRKKRRSSPYANYMPPPANFSVTSDAYMGHSTQNDATYYNSQLQAQQSNMVNSFGSQRGQNHHGPDSGIIAVSKTFFTYEELMEMTNGFARQNVIGEGGFGCVYKGWMADGRPVAIKQLKAGSGQGEREFRAEVEIISRVHHRHLVSLVGYCIAENQRLLIYEFVRNNTLEHHLHAKDLPVLEWAKRVKIAVGAAKGLAYLHEDCHPKIIHRDIKSANILLEEDFEAQVADFGLARLNDTTQTHVSTRVMGTFGYLAPEYAASGKLTDRSDVFSFGVVLLELITGRKPVDPTQPLGDESLVEWARPLLIQALETGDFGELIDPRLQKHYVESEMFRMIEAAAACVRHSAAKRPRMALVVRALDFEGGSDLSNGVKFGQSTAYNSGQYDEDIMKFKMMALGSDNSSEFDMYSGEYNSREVSGGHPNSWKSRYSSGEFTSSESETKAFKPNSGDWRG